MSRIKYFVFCIAALPALGCGATGNYERASTGCRCTEMRGPDRCRCGHCVGRAGAKCYCDTGGCGCGLKTSNCKCGHCTGDPAKTKCTCSR